MYLLHIFPQTLTYMKSTHMGTSLVVQGVTLRAPNAGWVLVGVGGAGLDPWLGN